jgi:hypothetical protein
VLRVAINSQRWRAARLLEHQTGLAVCASDPLKLHYSWCLSRIGAGPRERLSMNAGGGSRIRTLEGISRRIYSPLYLVG